MYIVCSDLEGVFVPEMWVQVAEKTGIKELRLTTRDISDYDVLMKKRLDIVRENRLKLKDIMSVIDSINPLDGAVDFLEWLKSQTQVIILSDIFVEFAGPLMKKLGRPTLFCNSLLIDSDGYIAGYNFRLNDAKRKAVLALKNLNYKIIAFGDSYNDITMLKEADTGILFRPPGNVKNEFPELLVSYSYDELRKTIQKILEAS
ncbi:MAG: bifunctional phosphoserine phosphatase/homoserine phosphotransferase ThrH [Thermodesulfobacteriota bacterium]|nr:bifunctional phosphoserine phosphatase/homoserine phosphotransferase ThrH [Thermodesulfobacteriota bacterium]